MNQLESCPRCDKIFVKTQFRDVCDVCFKKESAYLQTVLDFLRKKSNRTASLKEICEKTGVDIEYIEKFIQTGKIKLADFPNLGYPCKKCGDLIKEGSICLKCRSEMTDELKNFQKEQVRQNEIEERNKRIQQKKSATYYNED
jgi:flagellar operon protein (TIGR03826 family)